MAEAGEGNGPAAATLVVDVHRRGAAGSSGAVERVEVTTEAQARALIAEQVGSNAARCAGGGGGGAPCSRIFGVAECDPSPTPTPLPARAHSQTLLASTLLADASSLEAARLAAEAETSRAGAEAAALERQLAAARAQRAAALRARQTEAQRAGEAAAFYTSMTGVLSASVAS